MRGSPTAGRIAWLAAVAVLGASVWTSVAVAGTQSGSAARTVAGFLWNLLPAVFAFTGALIVSRQPRNVIGWLFLGPAVAMTVIGPLDAYLTSLETAPDFGWGIYLALVVTSLSWVLLIFPLLHLLQVFPTGRALGSRWRWLTRLEQVMIGVILVVGLFPEQIGPLDGAWTIENPIGFIPLRFIEGPFLAVWSVALAVLAVGGLAASVVRYRRAGPLDRYQIKLVLFVIAAFAVLYAALALVNDVAEEPPLLVDVAFLASIAAIPAAIAFAIVRRGLFDLDLIVRRTLLYAALSAILAGVYVAGVVALRPLIGGIVGEDSSAAVAGSTLMAAALFSPVRTRLQRLIDTRLFRPRYEADRVLQQFAGSLRDVVDLPTVSNSLLTVVGSTVHPRSGALWIRHPDARSSTSPRAG